MEPLTLNLPEGIAQALERYMHDRSIGNSKASAVQTALEEFLVEHGYLLQHRPFSIFVAEQGSGYTDTSLNHDSVLAESLYLQKCPESLS